MTRQSEQVLEDTLVEQLGNLGYDYIKVTNEFSLLSNLKKQLEIHNKVQLSDSEFNKILIHLNKGNIFDRAKILRDRFQLSKDDGTSVYLEFINMDHWCQNQYQVTNQVTIEGSYKNRYDVTLLVNGLPLVQVELKRRGLEMKEAFNQINRYQRHSFWSSYGLFQYVQLFVISNGVNTKYYANNRKTSYKQTFYWSDSRNQRVTTLKDFANEFLEKCHLSKMITRYTVLAETDKVLMVLRPYQYYAVEAIIDRVKNSVKNGYVWHTTGSGKTLTSFKASQIVMRLPTVDKVVFVVDRNDLDYQTMLEFNNFKAGSVDSTSNTKVLVDQLSGTTQLIVTTIQKLNTAISKKRYLDRLEDVKSKRIVFIFDECHRSQFGDTHKRITEYFESYQMFGFTGTPIFADNAAKNQHGKRTTKDLFDDCLHKYVITDAIRDENVLKFAIEYIGRYKRKESANEVDIDVEDINTKELREDDDRVHKITNYIINNHKRKTHSGEFTGLFCVSGVPMLIKYYEEFRKLKDKGKHNLKIATIFSYNDNEVDDDADGYIEDAFKDGGKENKHSRDKLDEFISDYNELFKTKFSTKDSKSFYNYYKDIAKRVKRKQVDILLVVNMFLTGFDSKPLNTLYVDKNLRYHGLIQAFSRTNRILNELKSQGNILSFRNLKKRTDEAIALFSNKDAIEEILLPPYDSQIDKFNDVYKDLTLIAPTFESVDKLKDENEELEFVTKFREIMRTLNVLQTFADFDWEDIGLDEQTFENYKSKYLDLYDKVRTDKQKEKVSVLEEVDFELELIHRDEINVAYILALLADLHGASDTDREKKQQQIIDAIAGQADLRSKRELIEKFINDNLPKIEESEDIADHFDSYWDEEKRAAFRVLCDEEGLVPEKLDGIIRDYLFSGKQPLRDEIIKSLDKKPSVLERKTIGERVITKMMEFVDTFINGVPTSPKVYELPQVSGMAAEE